jgi:hypothetical protein
MKLKKIINKISTTFVSLKLARFPKAVRSPKEFNESLLKSLSESLKDREAVRPELYVRLAKKTRDLIKVSDDLAAHSAKHPTKNNSARAKRIAYRENLRLDLIEFWGLLEKLKLRPVNSGGFEYHSLRNFLKRVRRDKSILDKLQSRYSATNSTQTEETFV